MDDRTFGKSFKAFTDPSRLRILRLLASGEKTVGEVASILSLTQPTASRQLAILEEVAFVEGRRQGQNVYYRLDGKAVEACCTELCSCLSVREQKSENGT